MILPSLQGLDPRTQSFLALSLSVLLLMAPYPRVLVSVAICWWMALEELPEDRRRQLFLSVLLLGLITLSIGAWMSGERAQAPWWQPTGEGLRLGAVQAARVSALGAVMAWALATIPIWRLCRGIEWTVRRKEPLHRAVHGVLFPFVLAWHMIPGFWDETSRQIQIYKLRSGPRAGGWKLAMYRTLVPGWINGIAQRAEVLAETLTVRGYSVHRPPKPMVSLRMGPKDLIATLALALLWGVTWL